MLMAAEPTAFGRINQPNSAGLCNYRIRMDRDSKKVLWENVSTLMKRTYGKENLTRLAGEAKLGPGTSTRLKKQKTSVGVDVLDAIARAFKVKAWQLLVPGLELELWPFPAIDPEEYRLLDASERDFVQQTAVHALRRRRTMKLVHERPESSMETDQMPLPAGSRNDPWRGVKKPSE